ncbi:MAG: hypothetical protein IRZ16_04330 [Myxococcaceae bacterium]|nr:hypothetical protein [Myxococcaceae bacterium]
MNARGKVSLGTVFWILILSVVVYCLWMFVPVYADDFDVRDALAEAINNSNLSDDILRASILAKLNKRSVGWHFETDPVTGEDRVVGGLGLTNDDIVIDRNTVVDHITIRVPYRRVVVLRPTAYRVILNFETQKDGPIRK